MKTWQIAALATAALFTAVGSQAQAADPLKAAVAADHRTVGNVARDAHRHPYETLSFFGIKPTDTVVELSPGGGWYTEILAPYLREAGQLYAAAGEGGRFKAKMDSMSVYSKVKLSVFDSNKGLLDIAPPGTADAVLTFRNVHNWMSQGPEKTQAVFNAAFKALKPGGVLGVEEHRLPASQTQDPKAASGYVQEAVVIKFAEAAGFKLAGKSEVNANPKDTADHPQGVWTLPPTLALKDKDRAKYQAIGESDRMTLKFVKP
ncbi:MULTISPECIES: class I SAM-dependent methyltransferase [unclassified Roseateles]|uniref:class I SAM-dependent methyltransferase n=1 Tax=unclassified Roseateles TaxID=2626991 RepID=UPI0006F60BB5|nr:MULTISPECIES: class I SAM-dependent methyltransferase [unclassified Roseateles]KQW42861.1 methyltransferase [Pelomonas sp. Root405]KRA69539.1 methyltransferase [Pelomonas sp. Root662]